MRRDFSYNVSEEVAVANEKANPRLGQDGPKADSQSEPKNDQAAAGKEIDEFFQRLPGNFRWPKPNADAMAAAVEAVQRLSGSAAAQTVAAAGGGENNCGACGGSMPDGASFCLWCGTSKAALAGNQAAPSQASGGQHHFHHHYHHFVSNPGAISGAPSAEVEASSPRGRAAGSGGTAPGGRAEAAARQVVQDWAQACNTKHIDDLLELYSADATLIRSSVPPVRSLPAIREFLVSLLEAGLGDVEMDSLRLDVMGDIAVDLGRCKMLVPVAMGKRREERGKYVIVLVKQPVGTWKILVDCWSSDLPVSAVASPGPAPRR